MKKLACAAGALSLALSAALMPVAASAQNVAIVNGKGVPKARVDAMMKQIARQGQPVPPDIEQKVRDEIVLREIFMQEAEKRGLTASPDYKQQLELARQNILLRELFVDQQKKNPVTAAEIQAEYDKFKAQAGDKEYHARHILVEDEATAKSLIAQLKGGAKFEDLAKKHSKDPGSAENGGDLDWAAAGSYVPEFSNAMVKLGKGQVTDAPVKSQFGFHVIRVDDVRQAQLPSLEEVKPQIEQRLQQEKMTQFQEQLRKSARTDYKFSSN
ncbi:peptidylprolyl isomerase [Caldimonas tepidiphila]|uniref:peptidylprolyl isomerase n=1 Tax=Caldimonas tepidiphila TaxID=2315841 RepID=UPI000E5B7CFD|nr:peptidylprolyl isomerase [Caldimonas tepidiphila]